MSRRFQNGSLFKVKRKGRSDVWAFRFYEEVGGKRVYRKRVIGTVDQFPLRRDAEKEVALMRTQINFDVHAPQTVAELVQHYEEHELHRKAFASAENHKVLVRKYIKPRWSGGSINWPWRPHRRRRSRLAFQSCSLMLSVTNGRPSIPSARCELPRSA